MSDFWDILLLAIILWILFIAGAFIYYRIIKPIKSGRASRMEEKKDNEILTFNSKDVQRYQNFNKKKDTYMTATQGKPEDG